MFLVFNAGFGLFLFFSYKYLFYTLIQAKYGMDSIGGLNIIMIAGPFVILAFYMFFLVRKMHCFSTFT